MTNKETEAQTQAGCHHSGPGPGRVGVFSSPWVGVGPEMAGAGEESFSSPDVKSPESHHGRTLLNTCHSCVWHSQFTDLPDFEGEPPPLAHLGFLVPG